MSEKHIVALSGGKDSTAMALRLAEIEPRDYTYICTPTRNELPEMKRHWERLGKLLGKPITSVTNGESLIGHALHINCLPNWRMRWCTRVLKIEPYQAFLYQNLPAVSYVGIRADEVERDGADLSIEGLRSRWPLVEWGWGRRDVENYLKEIRVSIPDRTDCALCFFQTLAEWWQLWRDHPEEFQKGVELEEIIGRTLRSEHRDTWPASLKELREEFEKGRIPVNSRFQLNLFNEYGMDARGKMCSICAR